MMEMISRKAGELFWILLLSLATIFSPPDWLVWWFVVPAMVSFIYGLVQNALTKDKTPTQKMNDHVKNLQSAMPDWEFSRGRFWDEVVAEKGGHKIVTNLDALEILGTGDFIKEIGEYGLND